MDTTEKFKIALRQYFTERTPVTIIPAKVKAVHDEDLIDVIDHQGLEIYNVRLMAVTGKKGCISMPKINSACLIAAIGNSKIEYFCISQSEIDAYKIEVGNTIVEVSEEAILMQKDGCTIEIASEGVVIKKGNESVFKLLDDLLTAILAMQFSTPAGPTTGLITAAQFSGIKTRLATLLK